MSSIRSLLWIGSGRGLAASGISEAPELDVTWVPDLAEAGTLPRVPFDGVLLEAGRVGAIGAAVARARGIGRGVPVLVCLPEAESIEAETALGAGAAAVLFLDPEAPRPGFVRAVGDALDAQHEGAAPALPEPAPAFDEAASPLVARSTAMREVAALVAVAASSPSTVLLTGETGAGKEVVARQLHTRSERAAEPFVPINCAAFPEALLESELFGHVKGAFTGADRTKPGLFEVAGAGTLFLDEIAEMDLTLQAKLLRVLQERVIERVGSSRERAIDVRIVAATNRDLHALVSEGRFRLDLFYRLNVLPITLPPLRERPEDVRALSRHFVSQLNQTYQRNVALSAQAVDALSHFPWPGNVRQLANVIERIVLLSESSRIGLADVERVLTAEARVRIEPEAALVTANSVPRAPRYASVIEDDRSRIVAAIARAGGNKTEAARSLGMTLRQLDYRVRQLGIAVTRKGR
jgi:transcriptional regulator with GAF, ATPase, and Fis domain